MKFLLWFVTLALVAVLAAMYVSTHKELEQLRRSGETQQKLSQDLEALRQRKASLAGKLCSGDEARQLAASAEEARALRAELETMQAAPTAPKRKTLPLQPGMTALAELPLADPGTGQHAFTKAAHALAGKNAKELSACLVLEPAAKAMADKLLSELDSDLRAGIGSGETLCALFLLTYYSRVEGVQLVGQTYNSSDSGMTQVRMQTQSGNVRDAAFPVRKVDGQWKIQMNRAYVAQAARQMGLISTSAR